MRHLTWSTSRNFSIHYTPKLELQIKHSNGLSHFSPIAHRVKIENVYSSQDVLKYGVPQGSVLGPIFFNIYNRSFYAKVQSSGFDAEGFADDHQLKRTFSPIFQVTPLGKSIPTKQKQNKNKSIQHCFNTISKWMNDHFLKLNPDKTKIFNNFTTVTPGANLSSRHVHQWKMFTICLKREEPWYNFGHELSLEIHVTKVVTSCFNIIRKISRIKKSF